MFVDVDDDGDEVGAVFEKFVVGVEHDADAGEDGDEVGVGQGVDDGLLDARGDIGGLVEGVVGGELELDVDGVGEVGGEEAEGDNAGVDEGADEDEGGDEDGNDGVAGAEGEIEEVGVDFDDAGDGAVDGFAHFLVRQPGFAEEPAESAGRIGGEGCAAGGGGADGAEEVRHVGGQDEEGLQEGEAERGDDNDGNDGEEFADDAFAPDEREEGGDGGADAAEDGPHDFVRAADGGVDRAFAIGVEAVDIFRGDNGVVDDHAEGHDHAEEGEHVDGKAAEIEDEESAGEGEGDAEGDHEGDAPVEEEEEDGGDEDERLDAVFGDSLDAGVDEFGGVADDPGFDGVGERGGFGGENIAGAAVVASRVVTRMKFVVTSGKRSRCSSLKAA